MRDPLYNKIQEHENLDSVLETMHTGICVTGGDGIVRSLSKSCEELYGIKESDYRGKHISLLEEKGIFKPCAALQVLKEKKKITLTQPDRHGQELFVTGVPVFMRDSTDIDFVITYASWDITRFSELQKKYNELQEEIKLQSVELRKLRRKTHHISIVRESGKMNDIVTFLNSIADTDLSILFLGEEGTGKGALCKHLHSISSRREQSFESVNCSAFPGHVLEDELFGYVKSNQQTGVEDEKIGLVEIANGGTLVLKNIEKLNWDTQGKILSLLQNMYYFKSGSKDVKDVDVRILATTSTDLLAEVNEKRFREELYYRLNVAPVDVPALKDRREDILPLVRGFLAEFNTKYRKEKTLSQQTADLLIAYKWPGNVREMKYLIERLVLTVDEETIKGFHLPRNVSPFASGNYEATIDLKEYVEYYEGMLIRQAFERCRTTTEVAQFLGISQATAVRKIHKYITDE